MNKQSLDERIKEALRPSIGPMNDVGTVEDANEWCKDENCTWLNAKGTCRYVEVDNEALKTLIKDFIQEVLPERKLTMSDAMWDIPDTREGKFQRMQLTANEGFNDAIDTINSNLDSLLTGEKK